MSKLRLFFTKSSDAWKCPRYYKLRHLDWLVPKAKPVPLERGSYIHDIIHQAHKAMTEGRCLIPSDAVIHGILACKDKYVLADDVRDEAEMMAVSLWEKLQDWKILHSEIGLTVTHAKYTWRVKLDSILENPEGLWQGEFKSTAQYASNVRRLYHTGIQPFIYLYGAREGGFDLLGTQMFVASKKECVVEPVIALDEQYKSAERYMEESADYCIKLETEGIFPMNRTQCVTLLGECPYSQICKLVTRPGYLAEIQAMLFRVEDPEAHLEQ